MNRTRYCACLRMSTFLQLVGTKGRLKREDLTPSEAKLKRRGMIKRAAITVIIIAIICAAYILMHAHWTGKKSGQDDLVTNMDATFGFSDSSGLQVLDPMRHDNRGGLGQPQGQGSGPKKDQGDEEDLTQLLQQQAKIMQLLTNKLQQKGQEQNRDGEQELTEQPQQQTGQGNRYEQDLYKQYQENPGDDQQQYQQEPDSYEQYQSPTPSLQQYQPQSADLQPYQQEEEASQQEMQAQQSQQLQPPSLPLPYQGPGQQPQQTGQLSDQPGQFPQQSGQLSQQTGQLSDQPGQLPQQLGQLPQQPGQFPQQPRQLLQRPGQFPQQPGQYPQQSRQLPQEPEQFPQQSEQLPQHSGQRIQQSGQLPQHSGQRTQQSGQLPQHSGQLPQQSGQLPQHSGQLPSSASSQQSGQLPSSASSQQSGQLPSSASSQQSGQLPSSASSQQSGQLEEVPQTSQRTQPRQIRQYRPRPMMPSSPVQSKPSRLPPLKSGLFGKYVRPIVSKTQQAALEKQAKYEQNLMEENRKSTQEWMKKVMKKPPDVKSAASLFKHAGEQTKKLNQLAQKDNTDAKLSNPDSVPKRLKETKDAGRRFQEASRRNQMLGMAGDSR